MSSIETIRERQSKQFFDNIDRIINAERISKIDEMKKLVRFIDQLIQSIINQILNGMLSEKGAKIKILQLFNIINHCMIGNHPVIKNQINRLLTLYENKFSQPFSENGFTSKLLVLEAKKVEHYVDSILDKHTDPIYCEQAKFLNKTKQPSMIDIIKENGDSQKEVEDTTNKSLKNYFLSTVFFNSPDAQEENKKANKTVNAVQETSQQHKKNLKRVEMFTQLRKSLPKNIYTTR
jgi:hypothetical protein